MKCYKCKAIFDDSETVIESYQECIGEFWGDPAYETFIVERCPRCGSEDIEEAEDEE